jgi:hypothetical protein
MSYWLRVYFLSPPRMTEVHDNSVLEAGVRGQCIQMRPWGFGAYLCSGTLLRKVPQAHAPSVFPSQEHGACSHLAVQARTLTVILGSSSFLHHPP